MKPVQLVMNSFITKLIQTIHNKPMNIYVPSSRMRRILFKWLNSDFEYMKVLNDGE